MGFHIIIPARYQSSRLPGKVLEEVGGKPILQHVYQKAEASGAESIVIATEDDRVREVAENFGATVCLTDEAHQTGTERIAEAVSLMDYDQNDLIVGLQADEPFIPAKLIEQVANDLEQHSNVKVASLCQEITSVEELFNPNVTKVILNHRKHAVYFSRAPIPWERDNFSENQQLPQKLMGKHYRHIGIYAYRAVFLETYIEMEHSEAEELEKLEQLRILWHGGRIQMSLVKNPVPMGVDTKEDLALARQRF